MALDDQHLTTLRTLKQWLEPRPRGGIASATVTDVGSGYTSAPDVTVVDASGTGAVLTATVAAGKVTAINVVAPGDRYENPTIILSGGGGTDAAAIAEVDEDAALSKLIVDVSQALLNEANLTRFYDDGTHLTESRKGRGCSRMVMKNSPITSVISVTIDGLLIPQSLGAQSSGWLFSEDTLYLKGYCFTPGVQNVTVILTAGEAQGSQLAVGAERACIATCDMMWKMRPHAHQRSQSAALGMGGSQTESYLVTDFPPIAKTWIENARRVVYAV